MLHWSLPAHLGCGSDLILASVSYKPSKEHKSLQTKHSQLHEDGFAE